MPTKLKCPKCGNMDWVEETTMGVLGNKNPNTATCRKCGATGKSRDWETPVPLTD